MLPHTTPKAENNDNRRNESDCVLWSAITHFVKKSDFRDQCLEYKSPETCLRTPSIVRTKELRVEEPYPIGNPISKPYFEAILGINNGGRLFGSTVYQTIQSQKLPSASTRSENGSGSGLEGDIEVSLLRNCLATRAEIFSRKGEGISCTKLIIGPGFEMFWPPAGILDRYSPVSTAYLKDHQTYEVSEKVRFWPIAKSAFHLKGRRESDDNQGKRKHLVPRPRNSTPKRKGAGSICSICIHT